MNNMQYHGLAVRLCSADLISGFISLEPVLGSRDELADNRLTYYCELLPQLDCQDHSQLSQAVDLTCADIQSSAIAVAPILYDRDEKITERLRFHLVRLGERGVGGNEAEVPTDGAEVLADGAEVLAEKVIDQPEPIVAAPPPMVKKGKKKKRRH